MDSASLSSFIDENLSFAGKFLKSFAKSQELKSYLSMNLSSLILEIEGSNNQYDLSPSKINDRLESERNNTSNQYNQNEIFFDFNLLTNDIPKTSIPIDTELILEEDEDYDDNNEIAYSNRKDSSASDIDIKNDSYMKEPSHKLSGELVLKMEDDSGDDNKNNDISNNQLESNTNKNKVKNTNLNKYNEDYKIEINQDVLNERIQKETDINLKEFYLRQLERINKDSDIFTNKNFKKTFDDFEYNKMAILMEYKKNFISIKSFIDSIIKTLIDKIATIPYTLRCICKIIYLLISKKFSEINSYEKNSFVGEFIFGKCIFPILINSDIHAIITTTILSESTRNCLKIIAKVLTKINRGNFFESNMDTDFTIFNHYIIEVIPLINAFYSKLIDVKLPKFLEKFIEKRKDVILSSEEFPHILKLKSTAKKETQKVDEERPPIYEYKYFEKYVDEPILFKTICFSLEDLDFLLKIINYDKNQFLYLHKYKFFLKTLEKIKDEEEILKEVLESNSNIKQFFLIIDTITNSAHIIKGERVELFSSNLGNNNINNRDTNSDNNLIQNQIKFCIEEVLKGLNLINRKDYCYFNLAVDNNSFFLAMRNTLQEMEVNIDTTTDDKIPLKWYSQFITQNKKLLPDEYKENDYNLLYTELVNQEETKLQHLKIISNILISSIGMGLDCADKMVEKVNRALLKYNEIEKYIKMEKFIDKAKIDICIQLLTKDDNKSKKGLTKRGSRASILSVDDIDYDNSYIDIQPKDSCIHTKLRYVDSFSARSKKSRKNEYDNYHASTINKFIEKIGKFEIFKKDIASDGTKTRLFETIEKYMKFVSNEIYKKETKLFKNDSTTYIQQIIENIEDHIQRKLYPYLYPKIPLNEDINFYKKTLLFSWLEPENFEIEKIYKNELRNAVLGIKKIDEGRSSIEKLKYVGEVYSTINNAIKFSTGKKGDEGMEKIAPIFQYVVLKAKPKRYLSNLYYIRAFLSQNNLKSVGGFLMTDLVFAYEFIVKLNRKVIHISDEDYTKNMMLTIQKYPILKEYENKIYDEVI